MSNGIAGIVGYGVYIPCERIQTEYIVRAREGKRKDLDEFLDKVRNGLLLRSKSIADFSEDPITMATEAAENALIMSGIDPKKIGSVVAGSESKPYAVGSTARHVASFIGVGSEAFVSDIEGACNAGMQSVDFVRAQVNSGEIEYGLAIGSDIAQAPEGDPLEYAAGAGAAAYVIGKDELVASIEDMAPYSSLTMDFWRREEAVVPKHLGKTTVEAYMRHIIGAIQTLLKRHPDLKVSDFDNITFHQPSGYMPLKTCKALLSPSPDWTDDLNLSERMKLTQEDIEQKIKPWLRVLDTGNTYAASTPISLASILDKSNPGDNILAVSYGSGAYAIATWINVKDKLKKRIGKIPSVQDYVDRKVEIRLETYQDHLRERLKKVKRRLAFPRIIGEIETVEANTVETLMCDGCKRIYYPTRPRCLEFECDGPSTPKAFPINAKLKSFERLPFKKRLKPNFDIIKEGRVLLVDCDVGDLRPGLKLELVIRKLDYEGKDGLIIYGPSYRPLFRNGFEELFKEQPSA
jgi:hydroxymethylglutaryl-CoA synthase